MEYAFVAGLVITVFGVVGYVVGTMVDYPGRAFTLTAVMVGLTLVAIGSADGRRGEGQ